MWWNRAKESFRSFNYGLYLVLFLRQTLPTIYHTSQIFGPWPDECRLDGASLRCVPPGPMIFIDALLDIVKESNLLPLYFCFGDSILDPVVTKNKIKTGFVVTAFASTCVCASVFPLSWPLPSVRAELAGIFFGGLSDFLSLVIVMHKWTGMLYLSLFAHMASLAGFDYEFYRDLNLGSIGIVYSRGISRALVFLVNFAIVWVKLEFTYGGDIVGIYQFRWVKTWSRIGLFSTLAALLRNAVHLIVHLRLIDALSRRKTFRVADSFIRDWLLLPIFALGDLVKQDVASNLNNEDEKKPLRLKLLPYAAFTALTLSIWLATLPGWDWFIATVLDSEKRLKPQLVQNLLSRLVPFYACFAFASLISAVLSALGRTDMLALKAAIDNSVIFTLSALFSNGIFFDRDVFAVASIFGAGRVCGTFINCALLAFLVKKGYHL